MRLALGGFAADVYFRVGPEVEACERDLLAAGVPVPVSHRAAWLATQPSGSQWYLALRDGSGVCRCGFALAVSASRALPGHRLLRLEDYGAAASAEAREAALDALAELARRTPRLLRVDVEVFSADDALRESLARKLAALGFERVAAPRRYAKTLALDLAPDEEALLASFQRQTRQKIRQAAENPEFVTRPIREAAHAERMAELLRETMRRSGGLYQPEDWTSWIAFSTAHPELSHILGTFRAGAPGDETLVAFVWGLHQGDRVEHRTAASTRLAGTRTSLTHPLEWALIRWAKGAGAGWFDLGGVTGGHQASDDPVGGISDFKRTFCKREVTVGEEWRLEPDRLRARIAQVVSRGAAWLSRVRDSARKRVSGSGSGAR